MKYDVYLVGVGGQGVLTVGEVLAVAAQKTGIPVNFYPSRGMAQRGGFVKAQLRLGRVRVGPNIPERGADLVLALELSEALKAVRYIKQGGDFLLFADPWLPTAVLLDKAPYPSLEQVQGQVSAAGAQLITLQPDCLPEWEGKTLPGNIFSLGVAIQHTPLGKILTREEVAAVIRERWKRSEANLHAIQSGIDFGMKQTVENQTGVGAKGPAR